MKTTKKIECAANWVGAFFLAEMNTSMNRYRLFYLLIPLVFLCVSVNAWATLTIKTRTTVDTTLTGFDGLKDFSLFQGQIAEGSQQEIDTPYRGLALLGFAGGQSYPVIIGEEPFVLQITDPGKPPSFIGSEANVFLYQYLAGSEAVDNETFPFAEVLLQAKSLLESTYDINTLLTQLTAKKDEMTGFVSRNYQSIIMGVKSAFGFYPVSVINRPF